MKRVVLVDDATGQVVGEWQGDEAQAPVAPSGRTFVAVADGDPYLGKVWQGGTTFDEPPAAAVRVIPLRDFLRRITLAEQEAFDELMETNRRARVWWQRLTAGDTVDLDHLELIAGFGFVKALGIPAIWPDEATADARIAQIRA